MSTGTTLNASGLAPDVSRSLSSRTVQPHEEQIIEAVKELYTCKPTERAYAVYADNAVFHDPIGIAKGVDSIRAQFNGLAKIFPRADIPKFRVLQNPPHVPATTILVDQDVAYYHDPKANAPTKLMNSLLTIETNTAHKVTRHTEEWNHNKSSTGEDGFLGMLNEERKKLTASLTDAIVGKNAPKGN